ncbi:hypothetical protein KIN20_028746 [Parelaphostrongylus tenuis]|uniref:Uncharacterized protein n=1 Tax=Parelaphostrongylus tenuis TaxID=148309 RepID=A0AAD5WF18_PARTN|nr:hypothetical protein KIN20_028746 [Parelaphostrongylus tenuis]
MVLTESGLGYMVAEKDRGEAGDDVLLDGDTAFAAPAVSDLRTLPDYAKTNFFDMGFLQSSTYDNIDFPIMLERLLVAQWSEVLCEDMKTMI